ncbi:MAG TPA: SLC13 family permease, partial [Acidimicrobiia bacterium]
MLAVALLAGGLIGALARPGNVPAWALPLGAALVAVATRVVDGTQLHDVLRPLAAPLAFVLVAVPLAASLDHVGVFGELAALAARSRHVVGSLWILAALVVALLNLDAAVVLLTPLYIRTALLVDVDPVALAFQPVLLASLASSVLVVSNLTNLLAASHLSLQNSDFLRHLALPSLAASAVGWFAYRRVFRIRARADRR